jgi:Ca2+-transporting ATPase
MEGAKFASYVGGLVDKESGEDIVEVGANPEREVIGDLEKMKEVRDKLKVLSRARPNDKYILVSGLQQLGEIVAVTARGTGDAPALKKADIGIAIKNSTEAGHDASDIIMMNDSFA